MDHSKPNTALFDVYLRLRPSTADRERFLDVEQLEQGYAPTHITIRPPVGDHRKRAVERFAFTRVFEESSDQRELFESIGAINLVEGVLGGKGREGRDGLLATLGVTGSGKSHTILGSRSQRGVLQLTLDLLFNHTSPHLVDIDRSLTAFQSLAAADVAESQLLPAANFLDSIYADNTHTPSRGATPAFRGATPAPRGATPALVRDSVTPMSSLYMPGAFPSLSDSTSSHASTVKPSTTVFDRLYPSLAKYKSPRSPTSQSPLKRLAQSSRVSQSILKLTSIAQESSFLSAPSSRRNIPRISTLPTHPPMDDVELKFDNSAEYAIVISMYEVHNDRIFDLLSSSAASAGRGQQKPRRALLFKSTEASPDRKVVAGLKKVVCSDLEEALLVLETGLQERRVAGTGSNATSSRSHGFFCVEVKKRHRGSIPGPWTSSTLTIVDLAGSERARVAKTAGATLAEAGKINESLMYLGQCMQMQSDNATATTPNLVPYRQCKLTELLFSNSFAHHGHNTAAKPPQKAIMIVTADPLGDFNATSQILRYSALAREVTVPRIPSVTSTILAGPNKTNPYFTTQSGRTTPSAIHEELESAQQEIQRLKGELEIAQLNLEDETHRRLATEVSWKVAESRIEEVEAEVREEVWGEMEARLELEMRRWRAARDVEVGMQGEHLDRKVEILTRGISVFEDEEEADKENVDQDVSGVGGKVLDLEDERVAELEDENAKLRERLANLEREKDVMRSPSKKMRVLKTRKWEGSGMGVDEIP
ncbi:hypothetical protein LTR37_010670 [Vermiconidia calcicola]|uniref:Uncharacterized protein n=1 Tax=Vermiconidia calcicola TaxID=1690605 RepID=A0ACC3N4E5_9PEZI|nr:hypothetical protein LTR37_010670 [Vermiconidia calcicola]